MKVVLRTAAPAAPSLPARLMSLVFVSAAIAIALTALPQIASAQQYYSGQSQRQPAASGGLFGSIFGGFLQPQQPNRRRYEYYGGTPYGNSYGYSNYYGSYGGYGAYGGYGRYRTLCVRTCDGYYWPMSFSTTRSGFARDATQCESSCSSPARLFVHRNPGADVEHMVDLQGKPYSSMENAFRYREEMVENCRCKPEPWSEAAKQEYERRAEAAQNPQAQTAANAAGDPGAPAQENAVAGWYGGRTYQSSPRYGRPGQRRYRPNEPRFDGRWWAGSW